MSNRRVAVSLVLALVAFTGCLSPRDVLVNKELDGWIYDTSIEVVWPRLRAYVFEQGYQASVTTEPGMYLLETAERRQGDTGSRLMATGEVFADGRCRVRIHVQSINYASKTPAWSGSRSVWMERELIKRVEPERWQAVQDAATAATATTAPAP